MTISPNTDDIGFLIKQIHDDIDRRINKDLRPIDLTMSQITVLSFLRDRADSFTTITDVQAHMGLAHSTTTGIVKRLASKGFLTVKVMPEDHRGRLLYLTEKAKDVFDSNGTHEIPVERVILQGLREDEIRDLRRILLIIRNNVK